MDLRYLRARAGLIPAEELTSEERARLFVEMHRAGAPAHFIAAWTRSTEYTVRRILHAHRAL